MALSLSEVKAYLVEHKRASLDDIATRFDSSPDAVHHVLETWIAKGRVRLLAGEGGGCGKTGSCCSCAGKEAKIYEWLG